MTSRLSKRGFQPSSRLILALEAKRTAGSPGRRGPIVAGTVRPVTRSTALTTSRTEMGVPLARLNAAGERLEREHVRGREVRDMDVVAEARPVGRVVVGAEDRQRVAAQRGVDGP